MKNKILLKLVLYFVSSFLVFAIILSVVFSILFSIHNVEIHKAELERHVESVAATLANILEDDTSLSIRQRMEKPECGSGMRCGNGVGCGMGGRGMMTLRKYLQFVENTVNCSIWIVDCELEQIDFGGRCERMQDSFDFGDLPECAELVIVDAFAGATSTNEHFSSILGMRTISAAAPIAMQDGTVPGVVVMHNYVSEINTVTSNGFAILMISMAAAVVISVFVAFAFSIRFTKPLNKMKAAALCISAGDYEVKTGVTQVDEIGELASVLDGMADKLAMSAKEREKLEKLRRDFVANVSHELRTPITVIRGSLEAILDGVVSDKEKATEFQEQMLNECMYLERLVTDLLDLSRLQNTDFAIETQPVDLKDIIDDVMRTMARVAEQKEVDFDFVCEENTFPAIGDYGRLRQMLINVVDNAIKFSPPQSKVSISLARKGDTAQIQIRDQGSGILLEDIDHIFERFYKQRSEQNKSGTGLGLAIAKQIADRHGIAIEVANSPDGGAVFTFKVALIGIE